MWHDNNILDMGMGWVYIFNCCCANKESFDNGFVECFGWKPLLAQNWKQILYTSDKLDLLDLINFTTSSRSFCFGLSWTIKSRIHLNGLKQKRKCLWRQYSNRKAESKWWKSGCIKILVSLLKNCSLRKPFF